jgi:hypothetical protein
MSIFVFSNSNSIQLDELFFYLDEIKLKKLKMGFNIDLFQRKAMLETIPDRPLSQLQADVLKNELEKLDLEKEFLEEGKVFFEKGKEFFSMKNEYSFE